MEKESNSYNDYDNRDVWSDTEVDQIQKEQSIPILTRFIDSLSLESQYSKCKHMRSTKRDKLIPLFKLYELVDSLQKTIAVLENDISILISQHVSYKDQNSLLIRQLNRKRVEIKHLNVQLITVEQEADNLRSTLKRFNITDTSTLTRLYAENEDLKEQLQEQQNQVYYLQQDLFHIMKEYKLLQDKNINLYKVVDKTRVDHSSESDETNNQHVNQLSKKKPSLWKRLKVWCNRSSHTTKRDKQPVHSQLRLTPRSASLPQIQLYSTDLGTERRRRTISSLPSKTTHFSLDVGPMTNEELYQLRCQSMGSPKKRIMSRGSIHFSTCPISNSESIDRKNSILKRKGHSADWHKPTHTYKNDKNSNSIQYNDRIEV